MSLDREEFDEAFAELLNQGLIEVTGITDDGQWLYAATEKGRDFYNAVIQARLTEIIEQWGDDVSE
jgi:predicted transcriptional regulator